MRRLIAILALLATSGLLGACGRSSHRDTTTGAARATTTTESPAGAGRALTKAQALAFAQAVNLTAADVPGFKASTEHKEQETPTEKRLEHELARCTGVALSPSDELAEVSSKNFKLEHGAIDLSVSSEVSVSRSPARAAGELRASRGGHVQACLSRYLDLLFKSQHYHGATVGPVSVSQGAPPAPGTSGGYGWRIVATIDVHNVKLPFYLDILGFVYGPAQVSLSSSGALRPFPAAVQQHLYSLLLQRAKAHRGL